MKTRILSSIVGLLILGVVIAFLDTLLLNAVIGALAVIAVYELLHATGIWQHRSLSVVAMLTAVLLPFVRAGVVRSLRIEIAFVILLCLFVILLRNHSVLGVEHLAMAFFFSVLIPLFFSCAVHLRDDFGVEVGGFYLLCALGTAWLTDTGAYFTGIKWGKHKLAPEISPKKTVEGAVGGVIVCTVCMLLIAWAYSALMAGIGRPVRVNYLLLGLLTPVYSVLGMLGDLSASVIKREFGVKDFGNIMPGHGGVMDRFDSVLFTLPSIYILVRHVQLVTLI